MAPRSPTETGGPAAPGTRRAGPHGGFLYDLLRGISPSLAKPVFSGISLLPLAVTPGFSAPSGWDTLGWRADFRAVFPQVALEAHGKPWLGRPWKGSVRALWPAQRLALLQSSAHAHLAAWWKRRHFMHTKKTDCTRAPQCIQGMPGLTMSAVGNCHTRETSPITPLMKWVQGLSPLSGIHWNRQCECLLLPFLCSIT